ncbi:hypothetical protein JCM16138_11670 [Thermococcus atlanticus]
MADSRILHPRPKGRGFQKKNLTAPFIISIYPQSLEEMGQTYSLVYPLCHDVEWDIHRSINKSQS